jgi:hypothetical protein
MTAVMRGPVWRRIATMNRHRLLAALVSLPLLLPVAAGAEIELGLTGGGQQPGGIDTLDGDIELAAGLLYGVSFGWRVRPDGILELAWWRQESEATGDLRQGSVRREIELDTLELGGLWESDPGPMRPFLGLQVGATRLGGLDADGNDGWDLSGGISGGARWFFGEHAILRLEGRLTGIFFPSGGAISCSGLPADCRTTAEGSLLGAFSARASVATRF